MKRNEDGGPYSFSQLKEDLIPYQVEMNYTHVEFMPPRLTHWDLAGAISLWATSPLSTYGTWGNFKISSKSVT